MRIGYNIQALTANKSLKQTDTKLSKAMEKLSSGYKVNHAKDNPSGLAIAKRMNSQISGLSKAGDNASDGISVVETADGAMSEMHAILQRLNELAVQNSTGSLSDSDRKNVEAEVNQLKEELTRIATDTEFNGQPLLDGSFDKKAYTDNTSVKVLYYSDEVPVQKYNISNILVDGTGTVTGLELGPEFPADAHISNIDKDVVTVTASGGFEMKIQATAAVTGNVNMDITGFGDMRMQIGANEGQVIEIRIPAMSLKLMGIEDITLTSEESSKEALDKIKDAITYVSAARSRLGGYQNRLETTTERLDIAEENMTGSLSRIMDLDMAEEMTQYTTLQVLSQAGTAMLAQANERPQQVLQLLQ